MRNLGGKKNRAHIHKIYGKDVDRRDETAHIATVGYDLALRKNIRELVVCMPLHASLLLPSVLSQKNLYDSRVMGTKNLLVPTRTSELHTLHTLGYPKA